MEAKFLAGVFQSDTHKRLQVAEELLEYFKNTENGIEEFQEFDKLVTGLTAWVGSSNHKVSCSAMEVFTLLAGRMKNSFRGHINTILPNLREKLGDAKEQVRENAQTLIQKILTDVVAVPQTFLDKLMESCLSHKNWRVKEQGLVCLTRTLDYFGGEVSVSRYIAGVVSLMGDANSQVRSCAIETIVDIYRHVGVKVRIDLSRRNIPSSRMSQLTARFNAVDATTGSTEHESQDFEDDHASISSAGSSNVSARTFGSTQSKGASKSRPPSARTTGSSGAVSEEDFIKSFDDFPSMNLFTPHDIEKAVGTVNKTLADTSNGWETRITALKQLKCIVKTEALDHTHFLPLLRSMEEAMEISLKDLRSQVVREATITLSLMATIFTSDFSQFAELMFPHLISLLANSAKVMATSAEVCTKMIIKNTPNYRLLNVLSTNGITAKSPLIRRQCSEVFALALSCWSTSVLEKKGVPVVESILRRGLMDPDAVTRKNTRQAFWMYHTHFPANATKMLDSFDPQQQRHINEAKVGGPSSSLAPPSTKYSSMSLPRPSKKKPLASIIPSEKSQASSPPVTGGPALKLTRPTVRSPRTKDTRPASSMGRYSTPRSPKRPELRPASSMENILDHPKSPAYRPPSRSDHTGVSGIRPPSRSGTGRAQKASEIRRPASRSGRLSRSCQPSPAVSRDASPTRPGAKKFTSSLTRDDMMKIIGYGRPGNREEEDDAASVSSERSSFSISSEVSVNPYARYTQPLTDLNELVGLCMSSSWSDRKDGIAQLHMLLDSTRPFSHAEMQKVRAVFKQMFAEPHAKVFSMFLDTLNKFIEEHREYIDDWLYLMLLRLIHKQGADMLSSVHFKLQIVLEQIRNSFEPDLQFSKMCRIVSDQTQPMNSKVKLAWLEYYHELIPKVEASDFKDTTEMRQALTKLIGFTTEPKSADVRRLSQKVLTRLFDLNPATLSMMLSSLPRILQEGANRILQVYVADMSSSGEESDREPKQTTPRRAVGSRTPQSPRTRVKTPSSRTNPMASLPPSAPRGLGGAKKISSSTPNMNSPGSRASRIPTPKKASGIPTPKRTPHRRCVSTTPGSAPSTSLSSLGRRRVAANPPRSQSVDPEKLAEQLAASASENGSIKRPGSARSDYTPAQYQNGDRDSSSSPVSMSSEQFSLSDLPHLDFGDDQGSDDYLHGDKMAVLVRELTTAKNSKLRNAALQSLFTQARDSPELCQWVEHFKTILLRLMELLTDDEVNVRMMCLRVLREMLKSSGDKLKDYAELTTMKVLKGFADSDSLVSQAAEDVFEFLSPALPSESAISLLSPMVAQEKYPMLLGTIKLLTKIISTGDSEYLEMKLPELVPGLIRGYSHSESSVRKASVFCLVALQARVGEKIREHLSKLSSSQSKLLDLYIRRAQQESR